MGISRKFKLKRALLSATAGIALLVGGASANPTGGQVREGQVRFLPGQANQIQQLTDKAIIDWQSFSIGANETFQVFQPGIQSVLLNRVIGQDPSLILGQLQANGNIFLINPNGILFGPNSVVNVGGLVASTMDLTNDDFLRGNYAFEGQSELGSVVNQGRIEVQDGGYAILTGSTVVNEGTIVAKAGQVSLLSGQQATFNLDGRDLIHYSVNQEMAEGLTLLPPGSLSAQLSDLFGVDSTRQASGLVVDADGKVRLASGQAIQTGEINVDGSESTKAGDILISAPNQVVLGSNSVTSAKGVGANSEGGEILLLAFSPTFDGFTDVRSGASLSVAAGSSGDAGFIEVSGDTLNLLGDLDFEATNGQNGTFLLDPNLITIINGDNAPTTIAGPPNPDPNDNPLQISNDVIIGAQWFGTQSAAVFVLESAGDILIDFDQTGTSPSTAPVNEIDFSRSGNPTNVTFRAGTDPVDTGFINLGDDSVNLIGLTDFSLIADGNIDMGNATVNASNTIRIDGETVVLNSSNLNVTGTSATPFRVESGTSMDLGDSNITVTDQGGAGASVVFDAGIDINLGTGSLIVDTTVLTANRITTQFIADGDIVGPAADGNPGTFAFDPQIEGNLELSTLNGNITLPDVDFTLLDIPNTGLVQDLTLSAGANISLGESRLSTRGPISLDAATNLNLGTAQILTNGGGDITLDANGLIDFDQVAINITPPAPGITDSLIIDVPGNVDLDQANIAITSNSIQPLLIRTPGSIDLDQSTISITDQGGGATEILFDAGTDIALGTGSLTVDVTVLTPNRITTRFLADGNISGPSADGNSGTFAFAPQIEGNLNLTTTNGNIDLPDVDFTLLEIPNTGLVQDLILTSGADINLGESRLSTRGPISLDAATNLNLGTAQILTNGGGDITLDANGLIDFDQVTINITPPAPGITDSLIVDVPGNVDLDQADIAITSNSIQPLLIRTPGSIDLDQSTISITDQGGAAIDVLFDAGTDIDLGTSSLTVDMTVLTANRNTTRFVAGNAITSGTADGAVGTHTTSLTLDGNLNFAATGPVTLNDVLIELLDLPNTGLPEDLNIQSPQAISLGESRFSTGGFINIETTGAGASITGTNTSLSTRQAGGDIKLASQGNIDFTQLGINETVGANDTGTVELNSTGNLNVQSGRIIANSLDPTPLIISSEGNLTLGDVDIDVRSANSTGSIIPINSRGAMDLGQSTLDILETGGGATDLELHSLGVLDAQTFTLTIDGGVSIASGDRILSSGSRIEADDIEIFGLDAALNADPNLAIPNGVVLDLVHADTTNLSVNSAGDVTVSHSGGGILVAENGGGSTPYAIQSGGDINITADNAIEIGGVGVGETSIFSTATNGVVTLSAARISTLKGGVNAFDVRADGQVILQGGNSIGDSTTDGELDVSTPNLLLDASLNTGSNINVDIRGNNDFLEVRSNQTQVAINDELTGNSLNANTGIAVSLTPLTADSILFVEQDDLQIGAIQPGIGKTVGLISLTGDIIGNPGGLTDVVFDGELVLQSVEGNVGTAGAPVLFSSNSVSATADGEIYLETNSDALRVEQVQLLDNLGQIRLSANGVTANQDVRIVRSGTTPGQLVQSGEISSANGGVGLEIQNGDFVQEEGALAGDTLVFDVDGSVGEFQDSQSPITEVQTNARTILVNVEGDVVIANDGGDLQLVDTAIVGGVTSTQTNRPDDFRVRNLDGALQLDVAIDAQGEVGLASGSNTTVSQAIVGQNVVLNNNISSPNSVVVVAGGNITQQSGTITAPQIGLGANGSIGTLQAPISVNTPQLAVNPVTANINATSPFSVATSVSAAGLTVNQGATTPINPTPIVPTPVEVSSADLVITDIDPLLSAELAQDNVGLVEETLADLNALFQNSEDLFIDLTDVPEISDDDFLRRKNRL